VEGLPTSRPALVVSSADGLSMPLITAHQLHHRPGVTGPPGRSAFKPRSCLSFLILAMDCGQIAVFRRSGHVLFFLAWELELLRLYLVGDLGPSKRQLPATQSSFYTAGGSVSSMLAGPWPWLSRVAAPQLLNTQPVRPRISATRFELLATTALLIRLWGETARFVGRCTAWLPDAHGEATSRPVATCLPGRASC